MDEYDVVELTEDIGPTLRAGTVGTIVMVYPGDPPDYEVEFVDDNNDTVAIRTVSTQQIKKPMRPD